MQYSILFSQDSKMLWGAQKTGICVSLIGLHKRKMYLTELNTYFH